LEKIKRSSTPSKDLKKRELEEKKTTNRRLSSEAIQKNTLELSIITNTE